MKVKEILDLLNDLDDDEEVKFLLVQHRTNLMYDFREGVYNDNGTFFILSNEDYARGVSRDELEYIT
jgi:hypothetical protein